MNTPNMSCSKIFVITITVFALSVLLSFSETAYSNPAEAVIQLHGQWRFHLDPNSVGEKEKWYNLKLPDTVLLPGTTDENKKGFKNDECNVDRLTREYKYIGSAWYQKQVNIPLDWADKRIILYLERTKETKVWVDSEYIGTDNSLSTPDVYDLSDIITPGKHTITIRVNNNISIPLGDTQSLSEHTQTNWNGIVGLIELKASDKIWMHDIQIFPDVSKDSLEIRTVIGNSLNKVSDAKLKLQVICPGADPKTWPLFEGNFTLQETFNNIKVILPLDGKVKLWDEFSPNIYKLKVLVSSEFGGKQLFDQREQCFGLRSFEKKKSQFICNDKVTFLRGKVDSCVYPLTGYPPMKKQDWIRRFKIAKSYGLNHYRFHSWCPPDAAFKAADEVGVYLQPELPNWSAYGDVKHDDFLKIEGERILQTYGNHPSFVMFSLGNELGCNQELMAEHVSYLRQKDDRHMYAQGSNNCFGDHKLASGDDYWTTFRTGNGKDGDVRGSYSHSDLPLGHVQSQVPSTEYDYSKAIVDIGVPVVSHEMGEYQIYPNFDEINKYTGVLKARNFEVFRERLKKTGMLDQSGKFFEASGALSVICYREDIEAAFRTPGFGGFHLLDLQDFSGQGTALVGILDAFMDSKGLISPEKWRQFCCETVLLLRFSKYIWTTDETFNANVQIAHYGSQDLENIRCVWKLIDEKGTIINEGLLPSQTIHQGTVSSFGNITISFSGYDAPAKYRLVVELEGTKYKNEYSLWVYPVEVNTQIPKGVVLSRRWNEETKQSVQQGGTVLLIPELSSLANSIEGFFASDFWCYSTFKNVCLNNRFAPAPGTLGILCDPKHPVFRQFPTEFYTNLQWWSLVMNSRCIILDETPKDYRAIIQVIDNFERNHKLGLLFECRVGNGRLMVCSIDLLNHQDKPEVRQLLYSLLNYMDSKQFSPKTVITINQLDSTLLPTGTAN